ncbi:DUF6174 domain-containing protein [Longimicrobium sp.]|uniref:DUF6174 domain-containing protein n=1 Tax=Longimicrobium sp. TaxID=2029185 RepID=UPI002E371BC9|nr:DUF6174 domain-containing protein [Longimicrobium sp.]HEX6042017.1 DUF6174 domain-containing protein [Longimicrobium sp.]
MISIRPIALLLALSAAACSGKDDLLIFVDTQPVEGVAGNVAQQRQKWEGKGIDDYRFAYSRVCFCLQHGTVQVTVRDGRVTDVRKVESGEPVAREYWREFPTVDELFGAISDAQGREDVTAVKFHPTLGYPVEAEIGTLANDAGVRHVLSGLAAID